MEMTTAEGPEFCEVAEGPAGGGGLPISRLAMVFGVVEPRAVALGTAVPDAGTGSAGGRDPVPCVAGTSAGRVVAGASSASAGTECDAEAGSVFVAASLPHPATRTMTTGAAKLARRLKVLCLGATGCVRSTFLMSPPLLSNGVERLDGGSRRIVPSNFRGLAAPTSPSAGPPR